MPIYTVVVTSIWQGKFGENTKKVKSRQAEINLQIPQSDIFRLSFGKSDSLFDISTHPKTGKTMLTYYTDNPDCEHDWFEIDETVEDAIVMTIRKILMKVFSKVCTTR